MLNRFPRILPRRRQLIHRTQRIAIADCLDRAPQIMIRMRQIFRISAGRSLKLTAWPGSAPDP